MANASARNLLNLRWIRCRVDRKVGQMCHSALVVDLASGQPSSLISYLSDVVLGAYARDLYGLYNTWLDS